jgi:choline dehydrogenase-like flavoprotein
MDHYDVIVIGSGPGGASLTQRLAPTGKKILLLERGEYLPRERDNWDAGAVFVDGKYQASETWYDKKGAPLHPGLHYFVGGNSKVYGAALLRLRERDFAEIVHADGISPAWPLGYDVFEPYYAEAEALFHVHGARGEDPNEPAYSSAFPYPPVSHEPLIQHLSDGMTAQGLHPFHLPLGILLDEDADGKAKRSSVCIRCDAFDGFPCLLNGKADAQVMCVDPALAAHENVTLLTGAYVEKLLADAKGKKISAVQVRRGGVTEQYSADVVVVACGALSSALLLLRSADQNHPNGLANGSDQVGRNYMRHNQSVLMALLKQRNDTVFQKTLAVSDYYFGADDYEFPLGLIQMCAKTFPAQIKAEALPAWLSFAPSLPFEVMSHYVLDFWLSSEDLPLAENRIFYDADGKVNVHETATNAEAHKRLRKKLESMITKLGGHEQMLEHRLYLNKDIAVNGTAHQAGTLRFGTDPATSVLDLNCKAHELDNLYVTDASFFPSIGAVNPTLTIVANALRVADYLRANVL